MSDRRRSTLAKPAHPHPDRGFTLVELLVVVVVTGLLVASLGALTTVIFRQQAGTASRLDLARAEQSLGLWLPTDLASADTVDPSPNATPCGSLCPLVEATAGSNAVMLTWKTLENAGPPMVERETNVSYRYMASGPKYAIVRVQCDRTGSASWGCTQRTVLNDAPAPPDGVSFQPGITAPDWALQVTDPPVAGDGSLDPALDTGRGKGARRAMVTVRDTSGTTSYSATYAPIAITAGSTDRQPMLDPGSLQGAPSLTEVRSRCGGSYAVAFDMSHSIGAANQASVLAGVQALVTTLAGTPMKLQVVRFNAGGMTLGVSGRFWDVETWQPHWFDMLDSDDVAQLIGLLGSPSLNPVSPGTNWEDALFRVFKNQDGSDQSVIPETLLFFTDGVPNFDRLTYGRFFVGASYGLRFNSANANVADKIAGQNDALGRPKDPNLPSEAISAAELKSVYAGYESYMPPLPDPDLGGIDPRIDRGLKDYVQEAWDRANFIAEQYRESKTRFIGVGVGPAFSDSSPWVTVVNGQRVSTLTANRTILARLISNSDTGVPAIEENGEFVNTETANMYTLPDWAKFGKAMQAIALSECGGTLTVQTVANGQPVDDQFQYQTTSVVDSLGQPVSSSSTVVTTSSQFPSGTFDLSIVRGDYVDVTVQPINLSSINAYEPRAAPAWECSARRAMLPTTEAEIVGSSWTGVTVRVPADAAVSCRLQVVEVAP
jgi:prepilin-type N-terminal cleavage/methylation domain-containing protein